ncbi:unnamed protein product, partial [Ectocarpus fasciculatus]
AVRGRSEEGRGRGPGLSSTTKAYRVPWSRPRKKRSGGDRRSATVLRQGVPPPLGRHHYPARVPPAEPTASAPRKSRTSEGERGVAAPRRRVKSGTP